MRIIKAQRMKWLRHVQTMDQARQARKLLDWKPMGSRPVGRPVGRPRQRWQVDVMEDLKKLKFKNWKRIAKDRITGTDLAEKAEKHKGLWCQTMMMVVMIENVAGFPDFGGNLDVSVYRVSIVTSLWARSSGVRFPLRTILCFFSETSRPVQRPTQPPLRAKPEAVFPGLKRSWDEAHHSPPSNTKVQK